MTFHPLGTFWLIHSSGCLGSQSVYKNMIFYYSCNYAAYNNTLVYEAFRPPKGPDRRPLCEKYQSPIIIK